MTTIIFIFFIMLMFAMVAAPIIYLQTRKEKASTAYTAESVRLVFTRPANDTNNNSNDAVIEIVNVPQIKNPFGSGADTVPGIVNRAINVLLALIVIAAVVVIIVAGFRMVAGGGNPEQIKKAKSTIAWAFAGMLVAFMSFAIVQIIQRLL